MSYGDSIRIEYDETIAIQEVIIYNYDGPQFTIQVEDQHGVCIALDDSVITNAQPYRFQCSDALSSYVEFKNLDITPLDMTFNQIAIISRTCVDKVIQLQTGGNTNTVPL